MRPHHWIVLAALACCVTASLTGCAGDAGAVPAASEPAPASAGDGSGSSTTPDVAAPTREPAALAPEALELCLVRSVDPPAGFFLGASPTSVEHLRAAVADVRRTLLTAVPERVARLVLEPVGPSLTVVPADGEEVTAADVEGALAALTAMDVDVPAARDAVEIVAPGGPPFSQQCAAYADAWSLMESNPDDGPTLTSLGFELERGVVTIGVTDLDDPRFAGLAAHSEVVEIREEPCCDVGA